MKKRIFAMVIAMLLFVAGCSPKIQGEDLTKDIKQDVNLVVQMSEVNSVALTDFAVRLFQASAVEDKNTLISPLSVLSALAMTANGAKERTLSQMESVFGMTTDELNKYFYNYLNALPQGEKYKLNLANSIWFTEDERFTVKEAFLQTNADYYGANVYKTPFDDTTVTDINNWVKEKTDGMIPEILDKISHNEVMYLVNALAFEAEWANIYRGTQIRNGRFTSEDGQKQDAKFMDGEENIYLEDKDATGFAKYYKDHKYAFVALLPKEGISLGEYVKRLNGENLNKMLTNPLHTTVRTAIPKFETKYEVEMSEILCEMGMTDAFHEDKANFVDLGTSTRGNIYINRVLHKTFISVAEKGTKAGATTVVAMADKCAVMEEETKVVYLDRPFVYMLIDCESNVPFFVGTMMSLDK
jgi:serpin B